MERDYEPEEDPSEDGEDNKDKEWNNENFEELLNGELSDYSNDYDDPMDIYTILDNED